MCSPAFNIADGVVFPFTYMLVLSLWATNKTCSNSIVPLPLIKIYSLPVFSNGTIWSKPTSRPVTAPALFTSVLLLPPKEPEFTTISSVDFIKTPIILELLDGVILVELSIANT